MKRKHTHRIVVPAGHEPVLERSYSNVGMLLRYFWLDVIAALIVVTSVSLIGWKIFRLTEGLRNILSFYDAEHGTVVVIALLRIALQCGCIAYGICSLIHAIKLLRIKKSVEHIFIDSSLWRIGMVLMICGLVIFLLSVSDFVSNVIIAAAFLLQSVEAILVTDRKKQRRFELRCCLIFLTVVSLLLGYAYGFCHSYELFTFHSGVSTKPAVHASSISELWQMSANSDFYHASLYKKYTAGNDSMVTIPGLKYADTLDADTGGLCTCTSMTPQGMAVTNEYIFVSEYCHTHKHNTVILVIDRMTGKYIKELVLDETTHAGGLAYDTDHNVLWVATRMDVYEDGKTVSKPAVACITQGAIDAYDFSATGKPIGYANRCETMFSSTSFITYHNGYLYTGCWTSNRKSISYAASFLISSDGLSLSDTPTSISPIPAHVQSIAFTWNKVILSISYGPTESLLQVYNESGDNETIIEGDPITEVLMPQMLEQVYPIANQLYTLFESASYAYRYNAPVCMDRIPAMRLDFIISKEFEEAQ